MITKKDHKFRKLGSRLVELSDHSSYKMAAILVRGGNIISIGLNKESSAPPPYVDKLHDNFGRHAEVCCLHNLPKKKSRGATMYVFGRTAAGNHMLTKPCSSCYGHLISSHIKRIVYETPWGDLQEIKI